LRYGGGKVLKKNNWKPSIKKVKIFIQ
jgi:hypothetical protein